MVLICCAIFILQYISSGCGLGFVHLCKGDGHEIYFLRLWTRFCHLCSGDGLENFEYHVPWDLPYLLAGYHGITILLCVDDEMGPVDD